MPKPPLSIAALVTRIIVVVLGLALFFERPSGQGGSVYWVGLLAPIFFLAALWQASNAFARIHRGDAFGPALVCALKEIGACLMIGSFAAIIVQPSLIFLIGNGFSEMRGTRFDLSVENLTLALIGFVLILLARQGQQLKSKLDEFV